MIDKSFVEKIEELVENGKAEILTIDDKKYCNKDLMMMQPSAPVALPLHTLSGVVDYIKGKLDDEIKHVISIKEHNRVDVYGDYDKVYARRKGYITACVDDFTFKFNQYYGHEDFVIALQAQFIHDDNFAKFMSKIGNIQGEAKAQVQDDGCTQTTTVRKGIVNQEATELPNPVQLTPRRTFSEIKQPSSEFVLRMRNTNGVELALFEASGGFWRVECIHAIRDYFNDQLKGVDCAVIA